MATETPNHLMAFRSVDKALIDGLKAVVYYLDKVDEISEERRKSMVVSLNGLIVQSELVHEEAPTRH